MRDGVQAAVGYAASPRGDGVAYARLIGISEQGDLLRQTFRVPQAQRALDRASGYAALTAVARALNERGMLNVTFVVDDAQLVEELAGGCAVPEMLVLPYVRLRCAFNALSNFTVRVGATDELTQRARAEAALNLAA
jgi:hypothetical protein